MPRSTLQPATLASPPAGEVLGSPKDGPSTRVTPKGKGIAPPAETSNRFALLSDDVPGSLIVAHDDNMEVGIQIVDSVGGNVSINNIPDSDGDNGDDSGSDVSKGKDNNAGNDTDKGSDDDEDYDSDKDESGGEAVYEGRTIVAEVIAINSGIQASMDVNPGPYVSPTRRAKSPKTGRSTSRSLDEEVPISALSKSKKQKNHNMKEEASATVSKVLERVTRAGAKEGVKPGSGKGARPSVRT